METLHIIKDEAQAIASGAVHRNVVIAQDDAGEHFALPVNWLRHNPSIVALDVYGVDADGKPSPGRYFTGPRWAGHEESWGDYAETAEGRAEFRQRWAKSVGISLVEAR